MAILGWVIPGIIVLLIIIFIAVLIGMYNALVGLRNQVKNAWAQIDVQLKRRYDLIPNLVETVKGYAKHERETLEAVVKARNVAVQASSAGAGAGERGKVEGELSSALARLLVVVEQYPDLKANQNFLALQEELSSTENKIGFSRQFYNDQVLRYNTRIETVPDTIIAGWFHFEPAEFFEVEAPAGRQA